MNHPSSQTSEVKTVTLSSKQLLSHIDSILVKLAQVVSVENKISIKEAIEIVRKNLLDKQFQMMSDESKKKIQSAIKYLENKVRTSTANEEDRNCLNAFKELGL